LDTDEGFSVALWCDLARQKIDDISSRGKVPVIVGGTGLFIDSLVDNIIFENVKVNEQLREELMAKDCQELYDELVKVDPMAAKEIHKNNKKRVVRALELHYSGSGKTIQNNNSKKQESPYDVLYFVINYNNRQVLYDRINQRVDLMAEEGLVQEAKENLNSSKKTCAQAIGHKELEPYLNGQCTLDKALDNLKQKTRNYAKRQITWFKRREDAIVLQPDVLGFDKTITTAVEYCEDFLNGQHRKGTSE
jgi:tRNA dimethylallyltransferase